MSEAKTKSQKKIFDKKIMLDLAYIDDFNDAFATLSAGVAEHSIGLIQSVVKKLGSYSKYLLVEIAKINPEDILTAKDCRYLIQEAHGEKAQIVEPAAKTLALAYELLRDTDLLIQSEEIEECATAFEQAFSNMLLVFNSSRHVVSAVNSRKNGKAGGAASTKKIWAYEAALAILTYAPNLSQQDTWDKLVEDEWADEFETDAMTFEVYVGGADNSYLCATDIGAEPEKDLTPITKSTFFKQYYAQAKKAGR